MHMVEKIECAKSTHPSGLCIAWTSIKIEANKYAFFLSQVLEHKVICDLARIH